MGEGASGDVNAQGRMCLWVVGKRVAGVLSGGRRGHLLLPGHVRRVCLRQRRRQRVTRYKPVGAPRRWPQVARAGVANDILVKGDAAWCRRTDTLKQSRAAWGSEIVQLNTAPSTLLRRITCCSPARGEVSRAHGRRWAGDTLVWPIAAARAASSIAWLGRSSTPCSCASPSPALLLKPPRPAC